MERFARVCPLHYLVLGERADGRLYCPRPFHRVGAWLVANLVTGEVLGAGRVHPIGVGPPSRVFLGPRLRLGPEFLVDRGERHYALPVPAHSAAA